MALFSLPLLDLPLHSIDDVRLRTRLSKGIDDFDDFRQGPYNKRIWTGRLVPGGVEK